MKLSRRSVRLPLCHSGNAQRNAFSSQWFKSAGKLCIHPIVTGQLKSAGRLEVRELIEFAQAFRSFVLKASKLFFPD